MKKKTVVTAIVGLSVLVVSLIVVLIVVLTSKDGTQPQVTTPSQQTQVPVDDDTRVQFVEDNDIPGVTDDAVIEDTPDDAPVLTDPTTVVAQFGDRTYTVADITNSKGFAEPRPTITTDECIDYVVENLEVTSADSNLFHYAFITIDDDEYLGYVKDFLQQRYPGQDINNLNFTDRTELPPVFIVENPDLKYIDGTAINIDGQNFIAKVYEGHVFVYEY